MVLKCHSKSAVIVFCISVKTACSYHFVFLNLRRKHKHKATHADSVTGHYCVGKNANQLKVTALARVDCAYACFAGENSS